MFAFYGGCVVCKDRNGIVICLIPTEIQNAVKNT